MRKTYKPTLTAIMSQMAAIPSRLIGTPAGFAKMFSINRLPMFIGCPARAVVCGGASLHGIVVKKYHGDGQPVRVSWQYDRRGIGGLSLQKNRAKSVLPLLEKPSAPEV